MGRGVPQALAEALKSLTNITNRRLDLSETYVGDNSAQALKSFTRGRRQLDLQETHVGDNGAPRR